MRKATKAEVLFAALRGAVFGLVIVSALDQALTAWHEGALWRGLAALGVGVVFAVVLYRLYRTSGSTAEDAEHTDPA